MAIVLKFHLNTPAVQMIESSTQPGATIKISGTNAGTAFTNKDYFATQSNSGSYFADNGSTVNFIINYLVYFASGAGNGIGKITGSAVIDADGNVDITATDIGGNAVTAAVEVSGIERTVNLDNPTTSGKIEYTTASTRYRIAPTPQDATIALEDSRDNTILPPVAFFSSGIHYALPVLNVVGVPNDVVYSVTRDSFVTATGKFTVTRTSTSSFNNTVTFSTDGNESSYSWNDTSNPRTASIELISIATEYDISFVIYSNTQSTVIATLNGTVLIPDVGKHYIIPFVIEETPLYYTVKSDMYHTVNGILLLKPDGSVEDKTSKEEIDKTIAYGFDEPTAKVSIQMMPSLTIIPTGAKTAILPVGYMLPECFPTSLHIYGEKLAHGKMEIVNNTLNDYQIIGVEVTGRPALSHNAFRTLNEAIFSITGLQAKFSQIRDIVELANNKYPGHDFTDYYGFLLFYFKNIYVSPHGNDCSNITSLDELEPLDMGMIWTGNAWINSGNFDGTQADFDAGLVYTAAGPVYAYVENDPRIAALAERLIAEFAFNFTFDDLKAGPIPYSVSQMSEQNKGLQFFDYVNLTPENLLQVSKMFNFILLKNSSLILKEIAMSSNGSYAHNGFINNGLIFAFEINLIVQLFEPEYSYIMEFYINSVSASNRIGELSGGALYTMGYRLTAADIERDFGANWLNAMRPTGFSNGIMIGDFPIITMEFRDNVVTVLYSALLPRNRNNGCRKDIIGRKIWIDNDNAGNTRPPTTEITLLRDGEVYKTTIIDSFGNGTFFFPCLIIWKNSSQKYNYQIDEITVPEGYTKSVDGYIIVNTLD